MRYITSILLVFTVGKTYAQQKPIISLNHVLIVVDTTTYTSLCESEFVKDEFAYSSQKQFKEWNGFYITGKNNYLEIFHPNSIQGKTMNPGENWTCFSSFKSGYVESLSYDSSYVKLDEDEYFKYLSCELNNTPPPFVAWEMNKLQYESWTKKKFEPEMTFSPTDYNSPGESDSSKNYLFNDIVGISFTIPSIDSAKAKGFFELCGYSITKKTIDMVLLDNGAERVTLFFKDEIQTVLVNSLELKLNQKCTKREYRIGLTKLVLDGKTAIWHLN